MFLTELELIADARPDLWKVGRPLIWLDKTYGKLTAPDGFLTDLASIPRVFRNLPWLDPNGNSRRPAVIHDWLYDTAPGRRYGKDFADAFLRSALLAEGATAGTARAFWLAVHLFGGPSWRAYRPPAP
jgi:hypothetical protein